MRPIFLVFFWILAIQTGFSQSHVSEEHLLKNKAYQGALAEADTYKAVYQLDSADPKIIEKTLQNVNNVLNDPRLKDKLEIEIVTFSGGTQALLKKNEQYKAPLEKLIEKGVIVAQCENSLIEQNRSKDEFFDFVGFIPSGNGELIIRAQQGWVIIKP